MNKYWFVALGLLGVVVGAYFSDLQEDGRKRWYNVVADRHWELQQVAKLYRQPLVTYKGVSHVEIPAQVRQKMSYLEGNTKIKLSSYSSLARSSARISAGEGGGSGGGGGGGSDYFVARRITNDEREARDTSVGTTGGRTATRIGESSSEGTTGSRTSTRIRTRYINFDPQGGGVQE